MPPPSFNESRVLHRSNVPTQSPLPQLIQTYTAPLPILSTALPAAFLRGPAGQQHLLRTKPGPRAHQPLDGGRLPGSRSVGLDTRARPAQRRRLHSERQKASLQPEQRPVSVPASHRLHLSQWLRHAVVVGHPEAHLRALQILPRLTNHIIPTHPPYYLPTHPPYY
jgi:hypothetical protein